MAAVLRLGARGAALLRAEAGPGGLRIARFDRARDARELPGPEPVTLLLPPGAAALARAETHVPRPGLVTGRTIEDALAEAQAAMAAPDRAILSCRPYAYDADGTAREEAPVGERLGGLTVRAAALTASVAALARLEREAAPFAVEGVITAPDALGAASLRGGEGTAVRVGWDETHAAQLTAGVVTAQARVPVGRRHLEGDLAQALALEPSEAARRTDAVLSGVSSDDRAIGVVRDRMDELTRLLRAVAAEGGLRLDDAVLSGLPPRAAQRWLDARPAPAMPKPLADEPGLYGAALLALGLRGSVDRAVLASPARPSWRAWLRRRF